MSTYDTYNNVLVTRYCRKSPLLKIFSPQHKTELWRQMWIWLAEAELELGLTQITQEAIDELKANRSNIDWATIEENERRLKHDVMAHNYAYGKVCPNAAGIIHLGATSCFVQDNSDLIVQREAVDMILKRLAICLKRVAEFSERHKETVTVGRTHYQPASPVTVGKRAVLWAQELLMVFEKFENFRNSMRFRGIKGATGTQDSFLTLFKGDEEKVEELDNIVTKKAGFEQRFLICGQTYSRQQDTDLLYAFSSLGSAVSKICNDIRMLQMEEEMFEPFEENQIGSSAMPFKRNPMKSERVCSFGRHLMSVVTEGLQTLATQGFERTLDDSAIRRINIPESFLTAEATLTTLQNIFEGMKVNEVVTRQNVQKELPFIALEKTMMLLTEKGVSRQESHEKIREVSLKFQEKKCRGDQISFENMLEETFFDQVRDESIRYYKNPLNFTGRCITQVDRFLNELYSKIKPYLDTDLYDNKVQLDV